MPRILAGAMMAVAVVTASLVVAPSPAQAATGTRCWEWQNKTFVSSPPRSSPAAISVHVCIRSEYVGSGLYSRYAWMTINGFSDDNIVRKFDEFRVGVRLEHHDAIRRTTVCNLTDWANNLKPYGDETTQRFCRISEPWTSSTVGGWTTDGYVRYDYDRDGEGAYIWELHGSPEVS